MTTERIADAPLTRRDLARIVSDAQEEMSLNGRSTAPDLTECLLAAITDTPYGTARRRDGSPAPPTAGEPAAPRDAVGGAMTAEDIMRKDVADWKRRCEAAEKALSVKTEFADALLNESKSVRVALGGASGTTLAYEAQRVATERDEWRSKAEAAEKALAEVADVLMTYPATVVSAVQSLRDAAKAAYAERDQSRAELAKRTEERDAAEARATGFQVAHEEAMRKLADLQRIYAGLVDRLRDFRRDTEAYR